MGNRLSAITTRTGDDGSTGLGDGSRVRKDSARVCAMGEVDELNSSLGRLIADLHSDALLASLLATISPVQHALFDLGGELAIPGYTLMRPEQVAFLDEQIAKLNADLPPLKEFILPGGSPAAASAHLARSICRRAERAVVALHQHEPLGSLPQQYLNRLSDLLFIVARTANKLGGTGDVLWQRKPSG